MERLVWEMVKRSIRKGLDSVAFDMRNALECGISEEEIFSYIKGTGNELFEKYKNMEDEELSEVLQQRTMKEMYINIALSKLEEGDED